MSINLRPDKTSVTNFSTECLSDTVKSIVVPNHNKVMLDQIDGLLTTIDAIDSISICCEFSDSQIMATKNDTISPAGGSVKTATLKLDSKVMFSSNNDIIDHLINGQTGVVKHFQFLGKKADITYIKCDDINARKKLIQTYNLVSLHQYNDHS